MRLEFKGKHISIDEFDSVELPNFVVLTGVNGSGKSHFLSAIVNKHIAAYGPDGGSLDNIVHFNYETFRLENENAFSSQQIATERAQAWSVYQGIKLNSISWRSYMGEKYDDIKNTCVNERKNFLESGAEELKQYRKTIKDYFKNNQQAQAIYTVAQKLPYALDELNEDTFNSFYKPISLKNNFLPYQLGRIFWDYYIKHYTNKLHAFENSTMGKKHKVLSEDEFIDAHGEKPWELINRILKTFDSMTYIVNSPEGLTYFDSFQLKLTHTEKENTDVDFNSLSSGEKILMALVASIYKSNSDKIFPDVLLLDEVDASLHPAMMKNMLDVIEKIFIREGVRVILVSHSPTTIALAPEDSIYIMNKSGKSRIAKKTKQEALSILTQGFATIEQGLKFLDNITSDITIITEGNNVNIINAALKLFGISGVEVLAGIEDKTGKNQLKTLFDFISRMEHSNKIIFVWDCDVNYSLESINNTYPIILQKNHENTIAKNGIENMFSGALFSSFTTTIIKSNGDSRIEFDNGRKKDFEKFIIDRNNKDDFEFFLPFIEDIKKIREST